MSLNCLTRICFNKQINHVCSLCLVNWPYQYLLSSSFATLCLFLSVGVFLVSFRYLKVHLLILFFNQYNRIYYKSYVIFADNSST